MGKGVGAVVNMISLRKIAAGTEVFSFGQFGSFILLSITRSPAQKPACKDLSRSGQKPAITAKATYVLVYAHNAFAGAGICV
ncbi:hypothetical protein AAULR_08161 [Lacticaseibacillus rhamnosus MTCC 5462]|nr:hypothetical protein AAULR_08161 [Lacticaseibacillus rhamnosus MTCC 5462]